MLVIRPDEQHVSMPPSWAGGKARQMDDAAARSSRLPQPSTVALVGQACSAEEVPSTSVLLVLHGRRLLAWLPLRLRWCQV